MFNAGKFFENINTIALGVIGSLIAAFVYAMIISMNKREAKINIKGSWGEYIKGSSERQYSFGQILYDSKGKSYLFDGTNFRNDGSPYCYWQTVASHLDLTNRQYFYIFTAQVENELDRTYYGFGVVNLADDGTGKLTPVDGHYVSANVDDHGMSHSMISSPTISYKRGMDGAAVVAFIDSHTSPSKRLTP